MLFPLVLFFVLSAVAVIAGLMTILQQNPVRCVLSLVVVFIASSGLWLLMQAEFLGLVLVLVYVGAVMTLFLFVVMMLDVEKQTGQRYFKWHLLIGVMFVAVMATFTWAAIEHAGFLAVKPLFKASAVSNTQSLGSVLYTQYAYVLELAAMLLLIGIVSAVVLTHRGPKKQKLQNVVEQLMVTKEERLRIIKGVK